MTTSTTTSPTRAILEDRYAGLLKDREDPADASDLQDRLDAILTDLIVGVARVPAMTLQEEDHDVSGHLIDACEATIRGLILDGIGSYAR
ncbi:MAG: hypothetical protein EPN50_06160 [Chloroflexota bacterium]|nr:MAG: hypothetical protein EPN50_06160 [Chloroflexota bacterium]